MTSQCAQSQEWQKCAKKQIVTKNIDTTLWGTTARIINDFVAEKYGGIVRKNGHKKHKQKNQLCDEQNKHECMNTCVFKTGSH